MRRFGEKLRTLRSYHNITQKELVAQFGLASHSYLSEVETGKKQPSIEFVLHTANFFSVTTDELLKDELELDLSEKQTLG